MKRDINEIYGLIKEKIENCENYIEGLHLEKAGRCSCKTGTIEMAYAVKNQLMAYTDVKILLETSGVLKEPINKETVRSAFYDNEFAKYRDKMFKFLNCNDHVVLPSGEVVVFIKKKNEGEYYKSKGVIYDYSKRNEEEKERS